MTCRVQSPGTGSAFSPARAGSRQTRKTITGAVTEERPKTTRIALDGRIGANVVLGKTWGLSGQIARYVSRATAKDAGAKAEWWPSGSSGAVGLMFSY